MPKVQPPSNPFIFRSVDHQERFLTAIKQSGKIYNGKPDAEYGAAFYLLTVHAFIWEKARGYVSRRGIDFETMLEEVILSSGELIIVQLASNLFNGVTRIDALELIRLDAGLFEVTLQSLRFRRTPVPLAELEALQPGRTSPTPPTKKPTV